MKYQVSRDGKVIAEFSAEDIENGLKEGSLVLTDFYWADGMRDWLPLSKLTTTPKVTGLARLLKLADITLVMVAVAAAMVLFYKIVTSDAEKAEARKVEFAALAGRLEHIQSELKECDLFLNNFELINKGHPDAFDKTKPIYPGEYRNKNGRPRSAGGLNGKLFGEAPSVPRFELFATTKGDGEIRTHIFAETRRAIRQKYFIPGQEDIECAISLDGDVHKIDYEYLQTDNSDAKRRTNSHTCGLRIWAGSLSGLVKMLRENKTPRVMIRLGGETADLEYDKIGLLECFEISEAVKRRSHLIKERSSLEIRLSELKNIMAKDAAATGR
jgi:hypothetical protein